MRPIARSKTRTGFTVAGVLVSTALLVAMGVVVVPAVAGQMKDGDAKRVGRDVAAIRGAAERFVSDVRRYPSELQQVTAPISESQSPLFKSAGYGAADVARWRGPYLSRDSVGAVSTGYGWMFKPAFEVDTLLPTGAVSSAGGQRYMVLKVAMPVNDSSRALTLDSQFDDGNLLTGAMRYRKGAIDTVKFLILPFVNSNLALIQGRSRRD